MRLSHFFIDRPIFAAVLSIILTIAGAIVQRALPVSEYPDIAPPTVNIRAVYPGASAQVLSETVATPIEQEVNGVDNNDLYHLPIGRRRHAVDRRRVQAGH
jgi:hydrophobic/amphiphilic exporter-1 (mainly G- bacteria), HAE1 family